MTWGVVDRERVLVANVGGVLYALADVCGHRGAEQVRADVAIGRLLDQHLEARRRLADSPRVEPAGAVPKVGAKSQARGAGGGLGEPGGGDRGKAEDRRREAVVVVSLMVA